MLPGAPNIIFSSKVWSCFFFCNQMKVNGDMEDDLVSCSHNSGKILPDAVPVLQCIDERVFSMSGKLK